MPCFCFIVIKTVYLGINSNFYELLCFHKFVLIFFFIFIFLYMCIIFIFVFNFHCLIYTLPLPFFLPFPFSFIFLFISLFSCNFRRFLLLLLSILSERLHFPHQRNSIYLLAGEDHHNVQKSDYYHRLHLRHPNRQRVTGLLR